MAASVPAENQAKPVEEQTKPEEPPTPGELPLTPSATESSEDETPVPEKPATTHKASTSTTKPRVSFVEVNDMGTGTRPIFPSANDLDSSLRVPTSGPNLTSPGSSVSDLIVVYTTYDINELWKQYRATPKPTFATAGPSVSPVLPPML